MTFKQYWKDFHRNWISFLRPDRGEGHDLESKTPQFRLKWRFREITSFMKVIILKGQNSSSPPVHQELT